MKFSKEDAAAIEAYAGTYDRQIYTSLRDSFSMINDVTPKYGIKDSENLTKIKVKKGVRAFRNQFDASPDDLQFSGRKLSVRLLKRDIMIDSTEFRKTWMGEHMKKGVVLGDIPFAKFIADTIVKNIAAEVNGDSYLAVEGDGTSVSTACNGFGTIIKKAIADENSTKGAGIVPVATGKITTNDAVSKFEMMLESMPSVYMEDGYNLYCSTNLWRKYLADYRERYGKYTVLDKNEGLYYLDGSLDKVKITPCTWMGNSQRIIATPKENLYVGLDGFGDMDKMSTFYKHELLEWRWAFPIGYEIGDLEAIRVNDQD